MKHPIIDPAPPQPGAGSFTWIDANLERPPVGPQQPNYPWDSSEPVLTRGPAGEHWGVLRSCPEGTFVAYWEVVDSTTGHTDEAEVISWRGVRSSGEDG